MVLKGLKRLHSFLKSGFLYFLFYYGSLSILERIYCSLGGMYSLKQSSYARNKLRSASTTIFLWIWFIYATDWSRSRRLTERLLEESCWMFLLTLETDYPGYWKESMEPPVLRVRTDSMFLTKGVLYLYSSPIWASLETREILRDLILSVCYINWAWVLLCYSEGSDMNGGSLQT